MNETTPRVFLCEGRPLVISDMNTIEEAKPTGKMDVHFSSKSVEWETPLYLFDELDREYHFVLDPCATDGNHKCLRYFTKREDGLSRSWLPGPVFMNPPYGRVIIDKWIRKAYEESLKGATVVCLLPSRTDTKWFHDFCTKGNIRFLRGRVKFSGQKDSAPFPSMIVVFSGVTP